MENGADMGHGGMLSVAWYGNEREAGGACPRLEFEWVRSGNSPLRPKCEVTSAHSGEQADHLVDSPSLHATCAVG